MPVGDLPGWHQIFADDFSTPAPLGSFASVYGSRWGGYDGMRDTSGHGLYNSSKVVSVANGVLDMFLHSENGQPLVAAPVALPNGQWGGPQYGRYSVRFKADSATPGYKIAFLLWPDSDRWNDGEVDYPEGQLNGNFYAASLHVGSPSTGNPTFDRAPIEGSFSSGWHTATTEVTPGKVQWFLDGVSIGASTTATPSTPMHMVLQAETMDAGAPAPAASAIAHVDVDWVTIYSMTS